MLFFVIIGDKDGIQIYKDWVIYTYRSYLVKLWIRPVVELAVVKHLVHVPGHVLGRLVLAGLELPLDVAQRDGLLDGLIVIRQLAPSSWSVILCVYMCTMTSRTTFRKNLNWQALAEESKKDVVRFFVAQVISKQVASLTSSVPLTSLTVSPRLTWRMIRIYRPFFYLIKIAEQVISIWRPIYYKAKGFKTCCLSKER